MRPEADGGRCEEYPERNGFRPEANPFREVRLMARGLMLGGLAVCVFAVVAAEVLGFIAGPLKGFCFVVVGLVAVLIGLGAVFLLLVSTTLKSTDVFFKKRRK